MTGQAVALGLALGSVFYLSDAANFREKVARQGRPEAPWLRNGLRTASFVLIAGVGLLAMVKRPRRQLDVLTLLVALNFLLAGLTLLWARAKRQSARETGRWLAVGCAVLGVGMTSSLLDCAVVVATASTASLVVGSVEEIWSGSPVTDGYYRFFGGVGSNRQALCACWLMLTSVYLYQRTYLSVWPFMMVTAGALTFQLLTRSLGAIWTTMAALALWSYLAHPLWRAAIGLAVAVAVILAGALMLNRRIRRGLTWALQLGRPIVHWTTFGGRREIWAFAWREGPTPRWVGTGYRSFWTHERQDRWQATHPTRRRYDHSHSSYLELLQNGGVLALALCLVTVAYAWRGVRGVPIDGPFMTALILFALMNAFHESTFALPRFDAFAFFALLLASRPLGS